MCFTFWRNAWAGKNEKNCILMGSSWFDGNAELVTVWRCSYSLERYEYGEGFLRRAASLRWMRHVPNLKSHANRTRVTTLESSSELQQCEIYYYSRVLRLWWCYSNVLPSSTADHQYWVLSFIFGKQPTTRIGDTSCRTHQSFCMTMLSCIQCKLWLI